MEFLINVHAQFLFKHSGEVVYGNGYTVRLFDKDTISDDFLGETTPDKDGKVHFKINPSHFRTEDSLLENKPDFYLVVLKNGIEIFRTPVALNIDLKEDGNFNFSDGEWVDMGKFLIDN